MPRDLVPTANKNYSSTFARMARHATTGEANRFGTIVATLSGTEIAPFNRVFVFERPSPDTFERAVEWMSERDVPFQITVTEDVIEDGVDFAPDVDLSEPEETQPGMVLASLDEIPRMEPTTTVEPVTTPEEREEFLQVFSDVFDIPTEIGRDLMTDASWKDDQLMSFLGRVDDTAVACGQLVMEGEVAGVYSIGVTEEFRRRGIGEAMTWEVLRAGRESGCQVGVLQSSEMGYELYEKMGFETVVTYHQFEPVI